MQFPINQKVQKNPDHDPNWEIIKFMDTFEQSNKTKGFYCYYSFPLTLVT